MLKLKIIAILQSILIVVLLCAVVFLLLRERPASVPASLEVEENTEAPTETTEPSEDVTDPGTYRTTGEKILLRDAAYGEIWLPVLADVPACTYKPEQTVTRNGLTYYLEQDKIMSSLGVDVSAHQKDIDWKQVKAAGVDFAIIRCGFRGYGSGELVVDTYFDKNMQGALDAGLDVGVYFYSQAISVEEAVEEAEMAIALVGDSPLTYPIVYDWEIVTTDSARTDDISVQTLTDCTKAFCDTIQKAGFTPMVYQNKRTTLLKLDLPALTGYDFWLAEYNDRATYYYDYRMWQYCSDGKIPGIKGNVDLNICYRPYGEETAS